MAIPPNSYLTLTAPSEGSYSEKGSRFLGFAWPLADAEEALDRIGALRRAHPKARHVCFAWTLGADGVQHRVNDDGEPSGTAGKPILGQITAFGLTNVAVAVVRYFGGKMLGTAGLVRAYRAAAENALLNASITTHTVRQFYRIEAGFNSMHLLMPLVKQEGIRVENADYEHGAQLLVGVPLTMVANFEGALAAMDGVRIQLTDIR